MSDRPILLFLDTSTITAFANGSIEVGEVMGEVADEQGLMGLPALCLAEAVVAGADSDMLDVLVGNPSTVVTGEDVFEWRTLATMLSILGGLAAASAACAAVDAEAPILTRTPELYEGLDGGGDIIAF